MGADVSVAAIPWKRALEGIDGGSDGVGGLYKTVSRLEKYDYSDKLFDEVLLVYVRKDHTFPYATIDSLTGRTIGVIRGWSYGDLFDDARKAGSFTVEEASGDAQNFTVLEAGHIDCVIAIREAGDAIVAARHLEDRIEALPLPLSSNPSYVAFNKSAEKREQLRRFDAAIVTMRADGSFARITESAMKP
jgi:polar amino acid transport system substrate-binding protein